jgi:hypothetical protein
MSNFEENANTKEIYDAKGLSDTETEPEYTGEEELLYPTAEFIADKLMERGYTYVDLVKSLLWSEHSNNGEIYDDYERRSCSVYSRIRFSTRQFQGKQNEMNTPEQR